MSGVPSGERFVRCVNLAAISQPEWSHYPLSLNLLAPRDSMSSLPRYPFPLWPVSDLGIFSTKQGHKIPQKSRCFKESLLIGIMKTDGKLKGNLFCPVLLKFCSFSL